MTRRLIDWRRVNITWWTAKAIMFAALAIIGLLTLSACVGPDKLTPAQSLFNIQEKYTEAGKLVLGYLSLPDCAEVGMVRLCSDAEIRSALVDADQEIWLILKASEIGRGNPATADYYSKIAVVALQSLTTLLAQHALTR